MEKHDAAPTGKYADCGGPGIKHDAGKPRFDLIDPGAELALVEVLTLGAQKYSPENWRFVERWRYEAAMGRHLNARRRGELLDPESGKPHTAHAMACLMFLLVWDLEIDADPT